MRTTLIVIISLGLLLGVADRVGAHYAEQAIADRIAAKLAAQGVSSAEPDVTITGFPFLTQVAGGSYAEVRVVLRDLQVSEVPLPQLTIRAHDVQAPLSGLLDGSASAVASTVTGVGLIPYSDLIAATGLNDLSVTGSGTLLELGGELPGAGPITGTAEVTLDGDVVRLRVLELTSAGGSTVATELWRRLAITVPIPSLPYQLRLTGITATRAGVEVTAAGSDVTLA